MKKTLVFAVTLTSLFGIAASPLTHDGHARAHHPRKVLAFRTLYGVGGPSSARPT